MTRGEHLQWCKDRANEYVDRNECSEAFTSMASDLTKHPETTNHPGMQLGIMMMMNGLLATPREMRAFINGFN